MYTKPFNGTFKASYANGAMKAGKVTYKLPVTMKGGVGRRRGRREVQGLARHRKKFGSGLNLVNKVDVEEYLKGVLKSEMSPSVAERGAQGAGRARAHLHVGLEEARGIRHMR